MQNTAIYFIRHGEVDNPNKIIYGRSNIPLNEKGCKEIEVLARNLKYSGVKPGIIYSSIQKRTVQSAEIISRVFDGARISQEPGLQEVYAPELEGKPLAWVEAMQGDVWDNEATRNLTIEKPEEVVDRVLKVVEKIKKKHKNEMVFVVGHGDPFAFSIWRLLHPQGDMPLISELSKNAYLKKGEAWKIVFNNEGKAIGSEKSVGTSHETEGKVVKTKS